MIFSEKQVKQLEGIKQWTDVNDLKVRCEQFKSEFENLQAERRRCWEKREQLIHRLENDVQDKMMKALTEEETLRQKLEMVKKSTLENKDSKSSSFSVENICLLLGYQISKCLLLLEHNGGQQKTLDYETDCHVTYNELKQLYEFVEDHSKHQEFAEIRKFLYSSQDMKGLLISLKKVFK